MTEPRPAPYPADTRAKGWRFELDYEQIEQSETWPLAAEVPMAQHALLMMWLVSWAKQVPCGSFPNDEDVIRASCRIPPSTWAKVRSILMRGWWLADDGRLYHPTLTKRVVEMMGRRRSDSDRQAAKRARDTAQSQLANAGLTAESRVTQSGVQAESRTDHRPPTTNTSPTSSVKKARKRAPPPDCPPDVDPVVWADWIALRLGHKAEPSATAMDAGRREAEKAGMTFEAFLRVWCLRGSRGLEASWLRADERQQVPAASFRQTDIAATTARVHEMTGGLVSAKPVSITRRNDALQEVFDAAPRRLG